MRISLAIVWLVLLTFLSSCGASEAYSSGGADYGTSADKVVVAESAGPMRTRRADAGPPSAKASPRTEHSGVDRKLIKTASLSIVVKKEKQIEPAAKKVERIAKQLDGYVVDRNDARITFKVPNGRLDEALTALEGVGKVKDKSISAQDVTRRFVDLQIRIENYRKIQARLQQLVEQGQNVEEILKVEKELARVTTELEALEGQMRLLQNQTAFATITVRIKERVLPGPLGWVFYGAYHGVKWLFVWD